jgi:KDO2-lipid IV(A) lauroyltransferase
MGNWELAGSTIALSGYPISSIARALDNPLLNRLVTSVRCRSGQRIIEKKQPQRSLLQVIKNGHFLGVISDQHAGRDGEVITFLGQPASTVRTPALLHLRYHCPMLVVLDIRAQNRPFHRVLVIPLPSFVESEKKNSSARLKTKVNQIVRTFSGVLEQYIRKHPEQWLWVHRRWRGKLKTRDFASPHAP